MIILFIILGSIVLIIGMIFLFIWMQKTISEIIEYIFDRMDNK